MKYNSALEDVEENSSKNDEFREICSFHRIVKIYIKNFKRLDLKNYKGNSVLHWRKVN